MRSIGIAVSSSVLEMDRGWNPGLRGGRGGWSTSSSPRERAGAARLQLHQIALEVGVRRRFAPHQVRHAHAVELLHEGIPLPLI
jgi:hypothetical protein